MTTETLEPEERAPQVISPPPLMCTSERAQAIIHRKQDYYKRMDEIKNAMHLFKVDNTPPPINQKRVHNQSEALFMNNLIKT
jgi:hypothetical protein